MSANRNDRGSISTFYSLCLLLLCYSATCTKGEGVLSIQDQSGSEVAIFDDQGNLYLNGGLTTNTTPQSTEYEEFRVQGYGQDVAIISMSTGDMTISGSLNENQTNMTGANNFVVKDNSSNPVAYIDTSGNLFLKGTSYIYMGDIDVDSNRSGAIEGTPEEDDLEETQRAIVPVNCDNDDDYQYPDKDCLNNCIDNESDKDDLIPLIIRKVPSGWTATLSIEDGNAIKIRVFNGNDYWQEGDDYWYSGDPVPADHSWPILGRQEVSGQESTSVSSYQIPDLSDDLTYYMEALEFRNSASDNWTIKLTVTNGSQTLYDRVKLRPSPFIFLPGSASAVEVYSPDYVGKDNPDEDDDFDSLGTIVDVNDSSDYYGDPWLQDEIEIGYTHWPNNQMWVVMDLPRGSGRPLDDWPENDLLGQDCGHFNGPAGEGGDIETTPPLTYDSAYRHFGVVVTGDSGLQTFIEAQGVQPFHLCSVSGWLEVGHIDEVVSFMGSGDVPIVDTDAAETLIQQFVNSNTEDSGTATGGNSAYLEDTTQSWDPNQNQWAGGYIEIDSNSTPEQVRQVISNTDTRIYVYDSQAGTGRPWLSFPDGDTWTYTLVARSEYRAVFFEDAEDFGIVTKVIDKTMYDETNTKSWDPNEWVGAYVMIFEGLAGDDSSDQTKKILSSDSNSITLEASETWDFSPDECRYVLVEKSKMNGAYLVWYGDTGTLLPACTTVRKLWADHGSYQSGYQDDINDVRDELTGTGGPFDPCDFSEIPAMFRNYPDPWSTLAIALIPNMVNLLNSGGEIKAKPFGPQNSSEQDVFELNGGGGSFVDCWVLHDGHGEVHCGTNAKRVIPEIDWWDP